MAIGASKFLLRLLCESACLHPFGPCSAGHDNHLFRHSPHIQVLAHWFCQRKGSIWRGLPYFENQQARFLCSPSLASGTAAPSFSPSPSPSLSPLLSPASSDSEGRKKRRKKKPGPDRTEFEQACQKVLFFRDTREPIEKTLGDAKVPLTGFSLRVILARLRSRKAALRLVLVFLKKNPSYVPDPVVLNTLNQLWDYEKERFPAFMAIAVELGKPNCVMTPRKFTAVLCLYGWAGMVDDVLDSISQCKEKYGFQHDYFHFSCALHTCIDEKRLDIAVQVFRKMDEEGYAPTFDSFHSLIVSFLAENQVGNAASFLLLMISRRVLPPRERPPYTISYITITDAYIKLNDVEGAATFLLNLSNMYYRPDYVTCTMVLREFSKRAQLQALDWFYDEMRARDLLPDPVLFNKLVCDGCTSNLTPESQQTLDSMANTLNSVTYFREYNVFTGYDSTEVASSSHLEVPNWGAPSQPESSKAKIKGPDITEFAMVSQLIYSFSMLGKSADAYELLLRIRGQSDQGNVLEPTISMVLFDALTNNSEWAKGEHILKFMMEWGHLPNAKMFNLWVQGASKAGHLDTVYRLLDEFNAQWCLLDAISYNMLVDKLCLAGKLMEAKKVAQEANRNIGTPDIVNYNRMIHSFVKNGELEIPRILILEMVEKGITPYAAPFTPIITRLCSRNKVNEALALLDEMEAKGCKALASLYTIAVRALCLEFKNLEGAFQVMNTMKAKGIRPEAEAHRVLFQCCMAAEKDKAKQTAV